MFEINGEIWTLAFVPFNDKKLYRSDGTLSVAACDDITKVIYVNESLPDYAIKKVLCHELTHAAMFSYNVHLSLDQEELLADIISTYGEEIIYITNKVFQKIKRGTN